jgi:hypothetical protein
MRSLSPPLKKGDFGVHGNACDYWLKLPVREQLETSAKSHFVILSEAKDLVLCRFFEILRSLRSLRMTGNATFAELSSCYNPLIKGIGWIAVCRL